MRRTPQSRRRLTLMSNAAPEPAKGRLGQMRQAYTITKRSDRNIGLILLLTFLVAGGVFGALGYFVFGTRHVRPDHHDRVRRARSASSAVLIVFGRRAEKAAYAQVEGQLGAAAGALQMLRRGWERQARRRVHQEPGRRAPRRRSSRHHPGRRGQPHPVRNLLTAEKKKHARIGGEDVPVHRHHRRQRRGRGPADQADQARAEAAQEDQAGPDDRRALQAQGPRRDASGRAHAPRPRADEHEGLPQGDARLTEPPASERQPRQRACPSPDRERRGAAALREAW